MRKDDTGRTDDADSGAVYVDGIDVREYRQHPLREKIAIAMQKSELFGVTVGENIAWGLPGADSMSLASAASIAQADSFISSLGNGYDTMVAERGMSLSGGQKQRISAPRRIPSQKQGLRRMFSAALWGRR